ncbi:uncharacterized protein LOC143805314 isoform X3 [Ranitomeya variabilis]|uniref:uncharacterized protein LOC143805314 isoform X3 n=1 Tax=Ranitomeya variabilis TaxID=490064 RepID=UPI00405622F8
MSAALEELLANVRAAALVRGEAWLQEKVAEILTDKGKASDPQDRSPCAKRVRSLGPRSPSTVPRNRRKVSSPGRDPPEVSAGQCPSSEMPCPAENPFTLDTDLRYAPHNFGDEDLRIPVNVASWHRSENGPKSEDVGIVCEEEKKSNDDSGQHYSCPLPNPRTDKAETSHSSSNGKDPDTTHSSNAEEESIELRIERLLQSCSAAIMQDQQEDEPSELTLVSTSDHECDACSGRGSPDPNLITPDTRLLPNIHQHPASASIIVDPKGLYHINQGAQSPPSVSPRSILHSHRRSSGRRRRRSRSTSRASLSPRRIQRSRSSDHSRCSRSSRRSSSSTSSERVSSSSASYGGQSKRHAETQESSHHSRTASQAPSHVASSGVPEPLSSVIPSSPAVFSGLTVWILGHSFIHWAEWRARQRCYGLNLSMSADLVRIFWFGIREQKWNSLMDQVTLIYSKFPSPDVIIIHLGGNDIGKLATVGLLFLMKQNFLELRIMFPNTILIFSEIVPRLLWLKSEDLKFCEKIRKRLNRSMSKFMPSIGGLSFRHVDLEGGVPGLFQNDWVHLSEIGTDIFNLNLKAMVELALAGAGPVLPTVG